MPNIDLGDPYETYVKGLLHTGLYSTYAEVGKDVIRLHMNHETNAKRLASINAALADGEADIQAGRVKTYSPRLINQLTDEVLHKEKNISFGFRSGHKKDFKAIQRYTFKRYGEKQALKYSKLIKSGLEKIPQNPVLYGHFRYDIPEQYKSHQVGKHSITYRIDENKIFIVTILHRSMDFENQLS